MFYLVLYIYKQHYVINEVYKKDLVNPIERSLTFPTIFFLNFPLRSLNMHESV